MTKPIVALIHLGCPKNLIDSEKILGHLALDNYLLAEDPEISDIVLINTCGFIEAARQEAIATIAAMVELKRQGKVKAVVAVGCMVQLYHETLQQQFPELDGAIGFCDYRQIGDYLREITSNAQPKFFPAREFLPVDEIRLRVTERNFAYLRIAEGCSNWCNYCNIPLIRGPMRSKPLEQVVKEARMLVADGAEELIIIGQDTASYGKDLPQKCDLYELMARLGELKGVRWLRLMYVHPAHFQRHFLDIFKIANVLPYLEMPIQHVHPRILAQMGRPATTADYLRELIGEMRQLVPNLILRSTVMVGFPGETEDEFASLYEFIDEIKFERLGTFIYSQEPGTKAAEIPEQLPLSEKQARYDNIMQRQQAIAFSWARKMRGKQMEVVLEKRVAKKQWQARSYGEAPEIDPVIFVSANRTYAGEFRQVVITKSDGYDLLARLLPKRDN